MLNFVVGGKEYTLEYSFAAAEHKETVQKMFNIVSGAYFVNRMGTENMATASINATSDMVADIPNIVRTAFHSGLLENHGVDEAEAYKLQKQYMKENKFSYKKLFDDIKKCMEEDGFFDLSGLTEMMQEMNENLKKNLEAVTKQTKIPQDHKKKQTSTKK